MGGCEYVRREGRATLPHPHSFSFLFAFCELMPLRIASECAAFADVALQQGVGVAGQHPHRCRPMHTCQHVHGHSCMHLCAVTVLLLPNIGWGGGLKCEGKERWGTRVGVVGTCVWQVESRQSVVSISHGRQA